jgi:hypothetical protein
MLDRRRMLRAGPAFGLGITSLALPAAAQAASFAGVALATEGPSTLTVDDTGTAAAGHDVTLRVRLVGSSGGAATGNLRVDLTVTLDDGSDGGAGAPATGTRIDGVARTTHAVLADSGAVDLDVDLPAAGTYLFAVTTTPAPTSQPDGVVLAYEFAG